MSWKNEGGGPDFTSNLLVLVLNNRMHARFSMSSRGIRQGNPILLFLLVIHIEAFDRIMSRVMDRL